MANRRTVSEHPTTDEEKIRLNIAVEVTVRAINNRNEIPIVIIRKLLGLHLIPTAKKGSTTQELFDKHIVLPNAMDVASKRIRTRLHILRPASSLKSQGMSRTKGISKGKPRGQSRREPRTGGREALRTTENLLKTRRTESRTLPKSEKRASDICTRGS